MVLDCGHTDDDPCAWHTDNGLTVCAECCTYCKENNSMSGLTPLQAAIRVRDAALRDLDRFDRQDKGSRWITHPDEGHELGEAVRLADAEVERLSASR